MKKIPLLNTIIFCIALLSCNQAQPPQKGAVAKYKKYKDGNFIKVENVHSTGKNTEYYYHGKAILVEENYNDTMYAYFIAGCDLDAIDKRKSGMYSFKYNVFDIKDSCRCNTNALHDCMLSPDYSAYMVQQIFKERGYYLDKCELENLKEFLKVK